VWPSAGSPLLELFRGAKQGWHEEVEQRPQLLQLVLHWCACMPKLP
jgi:hypothetical protein